MAKVSFNKLGLKKNEDTQTFTQNGQAIEVKQYLPIQQKLELLSNVINRAVDSNNFYNPGQLNLFLKLEIVQAYTNISFTEKQREDFCKTFDLLEENGIIETIFELIPDIEIHNLESWLFQSVKAVYDYNNSARAILESLQTDYKNLDFDLTSIQEKIKDPESLKILKEIAPLLDLV